MLDYKRTGPYSVSMIINKNAYKLDLTKMMRNHNIFHLSQHDRYTAPVTGQPPSEPNIIIVDDLEEEWKVDRIIDSQRLYWKLHYLVEWAGYTDIRSSRELAKSSTLPRSWSMTFTEIILTSHSGNMIEDKRSCNDSFVLIPFSSFGSRPSTHGVSMSVYYLPMEVEFPGAPVPPNDYRMIADRGWDFVIVMVRTRAFCLEIDCMYWVSSPRALP